MRVMFYHQTIFKDINQILLGNLTIIIIKRKEKKKGRIKGPVKWKNDEASQSFKAPSIIEI